MRHYLAVSIIIVLISYAAYLGYSNGGLKLGFIGKIQKKTNKISRKLGNGKKNSTVIVTAAPQPTQEYIAEHPKRIPEDEEEDYDEYHHKKIHEHLQVLKETMMDE